MIKCFFVIIFCSSVTFLHIYAIVAGADTTVARQSAPFFIKSDTNNTLLGFSSFKNGIFLEDSVTSTTFDGFFPVAGSLVLNGGTLHLAHDLTVEKPVKFGSGTINGNGFAITFPRNISTITLPTTGHTRLLNTVDEYTIQMLGYSVDWSHDNRFIALSGYGYATGKELQILEFDGSSIVKRAEYDVPEATYAYNVRWHPSDYYLALASYGSTYAFKVLYFDEHTYDLTLTDSANLQYVSSVAWSPNGDHVAVSRLYANSFDVFDITDGVLGAKYTGNFGELGYVLMNCLEWKDDDNIAIGFYLHNTMPAFQIFSFTGSSLNFSVGINNNSSERIYSINCLPETSFIAVGYLTGSQKLRVYEYNMNNATLIDVTDSFFGEFSAVYGVHWRNNGGFLAYTKPPSTNDYGVKVLKFDLENKKLVHVGGYKPSTVGWHQLHWTGNGDYLAVAAQQKITVLEFVDQPLVLKNAKLFFNSNVNVGGNIIIQGSCTFDCGGYSLDLSGGEVTVDKDANLIIEKGKIKGLSGEDLRCVDDTGVLTLRDVKWLQDDIVTFSHGAIRFSGDVVMSGNHMFVYQSSRTSTLLAKSSWKLDEGFTFSYDPIVLTSQSLLEFENKSSVLILNSSTLHTTVTGLQLTRGTLRVERDSYLSSEKEIIDEYLTIDEGIILGDGIQESNDMSIEILSNQMLRVLEGSLTYRNVDPSSWSMVGQTSILSIVSGARLALHQSINLGNGRARFQNNTVCAKADGKNIIGAIDVLGALVFRNL
ncbi:WD40 repeat domain-containing protein [Candidatus Dependentiae bacterium]|nr:WD40 repeat domain-containing protein [Candidatus Dependentiae bacterium]